LTVFAVRVIAKDMRSKVEPPVSVAEQKKFQVARDAATLQLLFKAARLANEKALARATSHVGGPPVRPAHTALFPHLDFDGVRLTDLAVRAGVTKQAVGPLVDDLAALGMVERAPDPTDRRAKLIRFSRRGYAALMHGLGVLGEIEGELALVVGPRRIRELRETLALVVRALENRTEPGS